MKVSLIWNNVVEWLCIWNIVEWEWLCINLGGYGIDKFIVTCSIRVMRE